MWRNTHTSSELAITNSFCAPVWGRGAIGALLQTVRQRRQVIRESKVQEWQCSDIIVIILFF